MLVVVLKYKYAFPKPIKNLNAILNALKYAALYKNGKTTKAYPKYKIKIIL